MSFHAFKCRENRCPSAGGPRPWRTGRTGLVIRNHRRVAVLLTLMALVAWLPSPRSVPTIRPTCRVRGDDGAVIVGLVFGRDGRTLATLDEYGLLSVWNDADCRNRRRSVRFSGHAKTIAASPDGGFLVARAYEPDILLYNPDGAGRGRPLGMPVREVSDLKVSPDGRTLAVSSFVSPEILLWDMDRGRERMTLRGQTSSVVVLAFAPDGRSLASVANGERSIRTWDLATGRPIRRLTGPLSTILAIAYSSDGRLLASAGAIENPVRLWDLQAGREVRTLSGPSRPVHGMTFSPDGRLLATASGDGTASLWSVATGRELRHLDAQADSLHRVAFSPDGKTLAAIGNDSDIRFWDVDEMVSQDHGQ